MIRKESRSLTSESLSTLHQQSLVRFLEFNAAAVEKHKFPDIQLKVVSNSVYGIQNYNSSRYRRKRVVWLADLFVSGVFRFFCKSLKHPHVRVECPGPQNHQFGWILMASPLNILSSRVPGLSQSFSRQKSSKNTRKKLQKFLNFVSLLRNSYQEAEALLALNFSCRCFMGFASFN